MTGTLITAEVDFDANGKQTGYPRVLHSVHRSAYGWIPVPITVIRNGVVTPDILKRTARGLYRVLHALEMLPDYVPDPAQGTRELKARGSVYTYDAEIFEPLKEIGDGVAEREIVGLIHHPETPLQTADEVASPYAGMVLCQRAMALVQRGDAVFQIAADVITERGAG